MGSDRSPIRGDHIRQSWLTRIRHIKSKAPFVEQMLIPALMLPAVALATNSLTQALYALLLILFPYGLYSWMVLAAWRVWRGTRGERRLTQQSHLVPMAIAHFALTNLYIALFFKWAVRGVASNYEGAEPLEMNVSIVALLVVSVAALAGGASYNQLVFPSMVSANNLPPDAELNRHPSQVWKIAFAALAIVAVSAFGFMARGLYASGIFLIVLGNFAAAVFLFVSMLLVYQLVVAVTDTEQPPDGDAEIGE
jgi:hypothetical protein